MHIFILVFYQTYVLIFFYNFNYYRKSIYNVEGIQLTTLYSGVTLTKTFWP